MARVFAKVVSFGNGTDIGAAELLAYAAVDPEARIVLAYVEDTSDGRALYEALRICARAKPTIVLKGGISTAGARAARSHTASLAGSHEVFTAACRQAGAALVRSLDEMIDLAVAVSTRLRGIAGPRAVLLAVGGGYSVLTTDALAECGIELPELDGATLARLREVVPTDGNSIENPIDTGYIGDDAEDALRAVMDAAARDTNTDFVITALRGPNTPAEEQQRAVEELAALQERTGTPVVIAARRDVGQIPEEALRLAYDRGVGVFASPLSAGRAGRAAAAMAAGPRGPAASAVAPPPAPSPWGETPQGAKTSSSKLFVVCAVSPGGGLVVVGAGPEAAVEVADEAVGERAQRLVVEVAGSTPPPVEVVAAGTDLQ